MERSKILHFFEKVAHIWNYWGIIKIGELEVHFLLPVEHQISSTSECKLNVQPLSYSQATWNWGLAEYWLLIKPELSITNTFKPVFQTRYDNLSCEALSSSHSAHICKWVVDKSHKIQTQSAQLNTKLHGFTPSMLASSFFPSMFGV